MFHSTHRINQTTAMSTSVWPSLPAGELKKAEDESTARELSWLLDSLQDTLAALKSGLEECYALLAPIEPGSTLVMSSARNEIVKGHITRVGTQIVKGTLHLRLRTSPPIHLHLQPTTPLSLTPLTTLRNLINQSLDCIDIALWTGDRHSPSFISSQLHLLHTLLLEAISSLKGPPLLHPSHPTPTSTPPPSCPPSDWTLSPPTPTSFSPPLPSNLALNLTLQDSTLLLTIRVLEPAEQKLDLGSRFAFAIGAQRRLEHDEMDEIFTFRGEEVRVKEKVRVEASADPSLLAVGAKLGALERSVRGCEVAVRGVWDGWKKQVDSEGSDSDTERE